MDDTGEMSWQCGRNLAGRMIRAPYPYSTIDILGEDKKGQTVVST